MTVHRPNYQARIYVKDVWSLSPRNRRYWPRDFKLYLLRPRCRWCRRIYSSCYFERYPNICEACGTYLIKLEQSGDVNRSIDEQDVPF